MEHPLVVSIVSVWDRGFETKLLALPQIKNLACWLGSLFAAV
jgi:hypothetical protein